MNNPNKKIIEHLKSVSAKLSPTLVRKKEQIKGMIWWLELPLNDGTETEIIKLIDEKYGV